MLSAGKFVPLLAVVVVPVGSSKGAEETGEEGSVARRRPANASICLVCISSCRFCCFALARLF